MMLACQVLSDWLALAVVDNLGHQLTLSDQFGLIDQSFVGLTPAFVSMLTAFCNGKLLQARPVDCALLSPQALREQRTASPIPDIVMTLL